MLFAADVLDRNPGGQIIYDVKCSRFLDTIIREDLQSLTLELCTEHGITLVIVTHNIEEAAAMGKKILLLDTPPNREARTFENSSAGGADYRESREYQMLCQTLRRELSREMA